MVSSPIRMPERVRDIARGTAWLAAAGPVLLLLQTGLTSPGVPRALRAILALLLLLAFVRPSDGLLATAALVPVAAVCAMLFHVPSPSRWSEPLVLAFIGGSLLHFARHRRRPLDSDIRAPAMIFGAMALASFVVQIVASGIQFEPYRTELRELALRTYFTGNEALRPVIDGMPVLEGVALFWIVARLCAGQPQFCDRLARMLAVGAAAAAAINISVLVSASLRPGLFWTLLLRHITSSRINYAYGDFNAAGSYFALALFVAAGILFVARKRPHWWLATAAIALATWMSGSRTAVLSVLLIVAGGVGLGAMRRARAAPSRLVTIAVTVAILAFGAAVTVYLVRNTPLRPVDQAMKVRLELAATTGRMIRDHPVFGIGLARFYWQSDGYLADWFRLSYYPRENAHNNVLQITAELGIAGLVALAWLVSAVAQRLWRASLSPVGIGLVAGLSAFAVTALAGHPLLTREVGYTFWLAFGLAAAYGAPSAYGPRVRTAAALAVGLVIITVPFRVGTEIRELPAEHAAWGVSLWSPAAAGPRTRTVGRRAVFFVPSDARGVIIPFRSRSESATPHTVDILFEGRLANRVFTKGVEWIRVNMLLPERSEKPFYRIEVRVDGPVPDGADASVDAGVEMGWIRPTR